jgi:carbon monoxide dehydrogenase subunit G
MITLRNALDIDRPVADVYDFIVNIENAPKWQPAVLEVKRLTPGPVRIGTQFREVAAMMGRRISTVCEITELEQAHRIAFRGTSTGPFSYDTTYTLEPAGNATRVNIVGNFRLKGLWRLLEPVVRFEVRKESEQELRAMKSAIESHRADGRAS